MASENFNNRPFPWPMTFQPVSNAKLQILARPVEHWAMNSLGKFLGEIFYHVGIEDIEKNVVYHVSDPIGSNDSTNQSITLRKSSKEEFRGMDKEAVIYYHAHPLDLKQQLEALERARQLCESQKIIPYNGLTINCQTVLLDLVFPNQVNHNHQSFHLLEKTFSEGFESLISKIVYNEQEPNADPDTLAKFCSSLSNTIYQSLQAAAITGTSTATLGFAFGPVGAAAGAILGAAYSYYRSNDWDGLIQLVHKATKKQRTKLLRRLQYKCIIYGKKYLRDFATYHRTAFSQTLRELASIPAD